MKIDNAQLYNVSPSFHGRNLKVSPQKRKILKLINEGLSNSEIAKQSGVHTTTVNNYRRAYLKTEKTDYEKYDFYYLRTLIDEGNSLSQIAAYYKKSISCIRSVLAHFNLKTQEAAIASSVKKEELESLVKAGKTQREIADALFLENEQTVTHLMKKFGLSGIVHKVDKLLSADKIANLIFRGLSPLEIAQKYKVDLSSILQKMKKTGLYEVYKELYQPHDIPKDEIISLIKRGYSILEIAEINHVSFHQMMRYIIKNKILKKDISVKKLVKSVDSGKSIRQISIDHEVYKCRVPVLLSENNLKTHGQLIHEAIPKDIVEANAQGCKTYTELAKRLDVSHAKAKRLLEKYGLSLDKKILVLPEVKDVQSLIDSRKYISIDEIAQELSVEPEAVERVINKNKIKISAAHIVRDYYSPNFAKWVSLLISQGDSPVQFAEMWGLSLRRVKNILDKLSAEYSGKKYINFPEIPADQKSPTKKEVINAIKKASNSRYTPVDVLYKQDSRYPAKEYVKHKLCKKFHISETTVDFLLAKYDLEDLADSVVTKLLS